MRKMTVFLEISFLVFWAMCVLGMGCSKETKPKNINDLRDAGSDVSHEEIEPGDLLITEIYLDPDFYSKTEYYANDEEKGPDGNSGYDSCDKFVEAVNATERNLNLDGVKLFSKDKEVYQFSNFVLGLYEAVVIFYRYEDKCGDKDLPNLGVSVKVLGSAGYSFVSADKPQVSLKKGKVAIDRVYYDQSLPAGISLTRPDGLDASGFLNNGQVRLVKHSEASCVSRNEEGRILAFSPGTCVDGKLFASKCFCDQPEDAGVGDVGDSGVGDLGDAEIGQDIPQLDECISLRIVEVYPSPSKECDKFIEIVREDENACSLKGVELYVGENLKHSFNGNFLGKALVLLSSPRQGEICELPEGTDYVQYQSSGNGQLGLSGSSGKTIILKKNGVEMDNFVYEVDDYYEKYPEQSFVRYSECALGGEVKIMAHKLHPCSIGKAFSMGAFANGDETFSACECEAENAPLAGLGNIVINEVYPVPKKFDVNRNGIVAEADCDEFIELVMVSEGQFSLAGMSLCFNEATNERFTFDSSHILSQYEAIVIFGNECDAPNWGYASVIEENARVKLRLTNSEGNVLLMKKGELVDIFSYPGNEVWTAGMQANGYSFVREPELTSNGVVLHPRASCLSALTVECFAGDGCAEELAISPGQCANQTSFEEARCVCE